MIIKKCKEDYFFFPFLMTALMTIRKPCSIHQRTWTKSINYLQGFHIKAISQNTSKYNLRDSKEDTHSSWWIAQKAQNVLSKKIKLALQRRGGGIGFAIKLPKKTEWTITKTLL